MAGLMTELLNQMSMGSEFGIFISDKQRKRILHGLFEGYYGPEIAGEVMFDTSRSWCARMPVLQQLFPGSKVIACVRDVPWIVDSIEQLVRKNALSPSSMFNFKAGTTVYTRADMVANGDGMLGYPYNALKEAFYGEHTQHLMLVQYESLVQSPGQVLRAIYQFIDEPYFEHNLTQVEYSADEFDQKAGTPGLHQVRPVVEAKQRPSILPLDVFRRFEHDAFWRNPELNPHQVTVV